MHPYGVLLRPIITEKSTLLAGQNKYVFEVDIRANKNQVREAIQLAFNVRVADVNTILMKGKAKRFGRRITDRPDWKKAIVTLVPGDTIELFEGI
ncbi:MAG: 50S ribosomal protein L23 [Dehalococcoidia bacterium]